MLLSGRVLCFAGVFARKQKDWQELVGRHGATVHSAITADVTHLILSPKKGIDSAKHKAALQRGISCLTEQELEALLEGSGALNSTAGAPCAPD